MLSSLPTGNMLMDENQTHYYLLVEQTILPIAILYKTIFIFKQDHLDHMPRICLIIAINEIYMQQLKALYFLGKAMKDEFTSNMRIILEKIEKEAH